MIGVGEKFPAFDLQGVNQLNEFVKVSVHENYQPTKHDYTVVYFYPKDFTFICPTEISGMDILVEEANFIGISGDNEFCKLAWKQDNELIGNIKHSLAADCGLGLSSKLGIVNEEAIKNSLIAEEIAGYGCDVYEEEPQKNSIFSGMNNVVMTPHIGAGTKEAQEKVAVQIAEQLVDFLLNNNIANQVNI
mgnify:CR=1 FL=1